MNKLCSCLAITVVLTSRVFAADLPDGAVWYLHADFEQMRTTDAGRELYAWFENEVGADLKNEFDIDLTAEIDTVTAFSRSIDSAVAVIAGPVSQRFTQKLMALAVLKGNVEEREHAGLTYFAFEEPGGLRRKGGIHGGFFSFDVQGRVLAASDEEELRALIDGGGRLAPVGSDDAMVRIAANGFAAAGLRPGELAGRFGDDDWNSRIIRNTEQATLAISDRSGSVAFDAELKTADSAMTQSIGNIVTGLLSLQAFNDDLDAPVAQLLNSTTVDVAGEVLSVSTVVEPAILIELLEH